MGGFQRADSESPLMGGKTTVFIVFLLYRPLAGGTLIFFRALIPVNHFHR
jgi:hypothetical protein